MVAHKPSLGWELSRLPGDWLHAGQVCPIGKIILPEEAATGSTGIGITVNVTERHYHFHFAEVGASRYDVEGYTKQSVIRESAPPNDEVKEEQVLAAALSHVRALTSELRELRQHLDRILDRIGAGGGGGRNG